MAHGMLSSDLILQWRPRRRRPIRGWGSVEMAGIVELDVLPQTRTASGQGRYGDGHTGASGRGSRNANGSCVGRVNLSRCGMSLKKLTACGGAWRSKFETVQLVHWRGHAYCAAFNSCVSKPASVCHYYVEHGLHGARFCAKGAVRRRLSDMQILIGVRHFVQYQSTLPKFKECRHSHY